MSKQTQIVANLRKWAKALRSGEYEQARGRLRRAGGYCCLGVAFKCLTGKEPSDNQCCSDETRSNYEAVRQLCGVGGLVQADFIDANDYKRESFEQIAVRVDKLIEERTEAAK